MRYAAAVLLCLCAYGDDTDLERVMSLKSEAVTDKQATKERVDRIVASLLEAFEDKDRPLADKTELMGAFNALEKADDDMDPISTRMASANDPDSVRALLPEWNTRHQAVKSALSRLESLLGMESPAAEQATDVEEGKPAPSGQPPDADELAALKVSRALCRAKFQDKGFAAVKACVDREMEAYRALAEMDAGEP